MSARRLLLVDLFFALLLLAARCRPETQLPRYIPIRWIELHAPRHPECQIGSGSFHGPLSTTNAWITSEELHHIVARMNEVYSGSDISFWLQSHDVYCVDTVAKWDKASNQGTPYTWAAVQGDVGALYPHAQLDNFTGDALPRERWLEKAYALYGDPHAFTIFLHNDHQVGASGNPIKPDILPQHGYFPWRSPAIAFMFLSGIQQTSGWEFDKELTLAHEIGHALGNCHTLDFDKFCLVSGLFPSGDSYGWEDHWDLSYVDSAGAIQAFLNRAEASDYIKNNGTATLERIDDRCNMFLNTGDGRATVQLDYDPAGEFYSESQVPSVKTGSVPLLQGLSLGFNYRTYSWQRNLMSYRYPDAIDTTTADCKINGAVDPYDYLTARFSQSQIEVMHKQLGGSVPFKNADYGTKPSGTSANFASRFQFLGDGQTDDFVWYSNGQGPGSVDPLNFKDMVAFRSAPADDIGLPSNSAPAAGDFNGDGLDDLVWANPDGKGFTFLWSWIDNQSGAFGIHRWQKEVLETIFLDIKIVVKTKIISADFDGNGADDLYIATPGESTSGVIYFKGDGRCQDAASCFSHSLAVDVEPLAEDEWSVAAGNFDGRLGDDVVIASTIGRDTSAQILWSAGEEGFTNVSRPYDVGQGHFAPYAGDFNGDGGGDILWYESTAGDAIFWWGSNGGDGQAGQMKCGPGNPACVDVSFKAPPDLGGILPPLTIGDFDGNGADDFIIRDSHEPRIFFSKAGGQLTYNDNHQVIQVALHNSSLYETVVGDFDGALSQIGARLGDDILLLYRPN